MTGSRLVGPVVKLGKQKVITGVITDVVRELCSVQMSTRGQILHGLRYIGTTPAVGDTVFIDFRSGIPVVHTNSDNLQTQIDEVTRQITATVTAKNAPTAPAPEEPATLVVPNRMFTFATEDGLIVKTGKIRMYNKFGESFTITRVFISVNTAPTGAAILVDIHKNGTTIFTTQSNRPTIAISGFTGVSTTIENATFDDGDYLQMDLDQKGSTIAGADLTVQVYFS